MPVSNLIHITGQVQGVGFRPYVYTLACSHGLSGYVSNNESGVIIRVQGDKQKVRSFYEDLQKNPPPLARIRDHGIEECEAENFQDFRIVPTKKSDRLNLQLTPDFGICEQCRAELADPNNRRLGYPFTTCVNCGPRWSLTLNFPFERENTTMREFTMCPECSSEYKDPSDRRFHSQTNSCASCGIRLDLHDGNGVRIGTSESDLFTRIAGFLDQGKIVAIQNTGGYLLCCDADNAQAVSRLRKRKKRPAKPFALMYPSLGVLQTELEVGVPQRKALESTVRPIVILPARKYNGTLALREIAPGLRQLGVMLPYSGVLELLARELTRPIVATSGNLHGSPIISEPEEAEKLLSGVADLFLHHDLHIANPQDDSVIKFSHREELPILFRRSRGLAPNYFDFHTTGRDPIMAMGSQLKSTVAFLPNEYLYLSQYLGNLDHYDVYDRFVRTADDFIRIFEQAPRSVLVDSHPSYLSTIKGKELASHFGAKCIEIQHHRAHFASVLGENDLIEQEEPVLGVIWDGTGYGDDKQIWGGEFFLYKDKNMERCGHFEYFDWLAGDKMAREPRLSLFSLTKGRDAALASKFTDEEIRVYSKTLESNQLKTSSVGRIFDAVASLLGICDLNSYEGEAAILLENCIDSYDLAACRALMEVDKDGTLSARELLAKVSDEMARGAEIHETAVNFLYTLASLIAQMAVSKGVRKVAFSGGVFQNSVLCDMVEELMRGRFETYFNVNLAPNDENISYGQVLYHLYGIRSVEETREI
jgi:hydrogenase maturation protein HypF